MNRHNWFPFCHGSSGCRGKRRKTPTVARPAACLKGLEMVDNPDLCSCRSTNPMAKRKAPSYTTDLNCSGNSSFLLALQYRFIVTTHIPIGGSISACRYTTTPSDAGSSVRIEYPLLRLAHVPERFCRSACISTEERQPAQCARTGKYHSSILRPAIPFLAD